MTFERGANLTTATTLGFAETADLGPTAGNGFHTRWPDDLAALRRLGVSDLRVALDWARLQPRPGGLDAGWTEWFGSVLDATDALGIRAWVTLHESAIPRWFDNEGGFDSDEALTKWWPRWVERAADRFGDRAHGWIPFATVAQDAPLQAWRDTWGILGGGGRPVVASIDADAGTLDVERLIGLTDLLGIDCRAPEISATNGRADPLAAAIRDIAEWASSTPLLITAVSVAAASVSPVQVEAVSVAPGQVATDEIERIVAVLDDAIHDGISIEVAFFEPAISGPGSTIGVLDEDRSPSPVAPAFLLPVG